ncbi:hypothetical protein B586_19895 [Mycobacterium haemophilum DSM 44634]|nr:hypothetical protein B586_19895 [Mycobacterium haemophilum DSM 44634]
MGGIGQQLIRADHGLGQLLDRVISQVNSGLVNHLTRPDKRQSGDRACDRNPQNDVHRGSPSPWPPGNQQCPGIITLRYRR